MENAGREWPRTRGTENGTENGTEFGTEFVLGLKRDAGHKYKQTEPPQKSAKRGRHETPFRDPKNRGKTGWHLRGVSESWRDELDKHAPCDGRNSPRMRRARGPKRYGVAAGPPPQCSTEVANEPDPAPRKYKKCKRRENNARHDGSREPGRRPRTRKAS